MARKLMMNNVKNTNNDDNIVMDSLITWFDGRYYNANSFVDRVTNSLEAEASYFSSFTHNEIGSTPISSDVNLKKFLSPTIYNVSPKGMTIELTLAGNPIGGTWCPFLCVGKNLLKIRNAYNWMRFDNDSINTTDTNLWTKDATKYHIFVVTINGDLSEGSVRYNNKGVYNLKMTSLSLTDFRIGVYDNITDYIGATFVSLRVYNKILTEDEILMNRTYEINKIGG